MFKRKKRAQALGDKLVQAGKISRSELNGFLEQERRSGQSLGDLVVDGGYVTENELHGYLSRSDSRRRLFELSERAALDVTESYLLQTALKFTLFSDDPIQTLLVTSALPGEGKTVCASYLARALATVRQGRFLLVDADLFNPTVHVRHRAPLGPGWTDCLVNGHTLDECLCATGLPNLQLLPAGSIPPNPAVFFASRRMRQFMEELKARFELVVFDSSPILPVSAGGVLGAQFDAAILVVKAGSTRRQLVRKAATLLQESRTRVIGVVLNQVDDSEIPGYAYDYYGYGRYGHSRRGGSR